MSLDCWIDLATLGLSVASLTMSILTSIELRK